MLAIKREFSSNIIDLQAPPEPSVNSVVRYMRCGRLITGKLLGTHWYNIQRYSALVCEYIVVPDRGHSNLSFHVVPEEDIVWSKLEPVCQRCQDIGYIGVRNGDDDQICPACGDVGEVVF